MGLVFLTVGVASLYLGVSADDQLTEDEKLKHYRPYSREVDDLSENFLERIINELLSKKSRIVFGLLMIAAGALVLMGK